MKKYILNQLGVRLAVFLLIPVLLVRPVDFLVSLFAPRLVSNHIQIAYFVAVTIRAYLIAFPILCLMMKPLPPKTPERRPMGFRAFLGMLCALGCVMFFGARIGDALDSFLHSFAGEGLPGFVRKTGFKELLWADFMMAGIFAPITEELAFRKFLLDRALPKCGTGMSVLLSGLMFGLAHGNFDQFFSRRARDLCLPGYIFRRGMSSIRFSAIWR